ncbi:MAG: DUF2784 domain-containing protein [SAR324 cluster bacterium]|nr:DUF2784 domain-containing protein [SAR324 cluster bacterium]
MDTATLAEIVLVAHLFYAGFVAFGFVTIPLGAALGWRWIRNRPFRYLHVAAMGIVGVEVVIGMTCPLTDLEYALRGEAGLAGDESGFMGRIVASLLYYDFPPWVFTVAHIGLTLLAVALLIWIPPRKRRATRTP